jgi:hypothetical protein
MFERSEDAENFLQAGLELEGQILQRSTEIREGSKVAYGSALLDARLLCVSLFAEIIRCKQMIPGSSNDKISAQLQLATSFIQGISCTETLISEGQYVKAAAALKQDYEIFTRVLEVEAGAAKVGEVPHIRHAPEPSRKYYGQLNDVAHPSNPDTLQQLLDSYQAGTIRGLSPLPHLVKETALAMYELHVWLCFEMARECLKIALKLYGPEDAAILQCVRIFGGIDSAMTAAGFKTMTVPKGGGRDP